MSYRSFTKLDVYKKCRIFRKEISELTKEFFPKEEKYLLKSQIKRASRLVTANIAEGHGRHFYKANIKFCRMARGSLEETMEHLITAYDEKFISKEHLTKLKFIYDDCYRLLNGYILHLKNTKPGDDDDTNH